MKNVPFTTRHAARTIAIVAGVLGAAFVAVPPAANAGGPPAPHEVLREIHHRASNDVRHVTRVVDHSLQYRDDYRGDRARRLPRYVHRPSYNRRSYYGQPYYRPSYYGQSYYAPSYGYPVPIGGYGYDRPCHTRPFVKAYIALPHLGFAVGVGRDGRDYRDGDYDRYGDRDDDRREDYDDEDGY